MGVKLEIADSIARLMIDREANLNALDVPTMRGLLDAISSVGETEARVLVMGGAGRNFCAGADLAAVNADPTASLTMLTMVNELLPRLRNLKMPIVAAWEGVAIGAGAGLALAADIRVVGRTASLITGHLRIGVTPDAGLSHYLVRALGAPQALSLMLRNGRLTGLELQSKGLADELVAEGEAWPTATTLGARLAKISAPLAVLGLRKLVDTAHANSLEEQLEAEAEMIRIVTASSDFGEGVRAFLEHRPPSFTGA
jgi:2-(1,2-epoxy-1,2-dihydrophenyl)acetyl-CoA isomerase